MVAALYALCTLAPSMALAFTGDAAAAHCLEDLIIAMPPHHDHHGHADEATHTHADGTILHHHHASAGSHKQPEGGGKAHNGDCCGLFAMSALAADAAFTFGKLTFSVTIFPALDDALDGRTPDRINRPPIS